MATTETNEAKRAEMREIIAEAFGKGWSRAELAAYAGVSEGTIGSYARGASMGTNTIRSTLLAAALGKREAVLASKRESLRRSVEVSLRRASDADARPDRRDWASRRPADWFRRCAEDYAARLAVLEAAR